MPTGSETDKKLFYGFDEKAEWVEIASPTLDTRPDDEVPPDIAKYFGRGAIRFEIPREIYEHWGEMIEKEISIYCRSNNWRKMHQLPMIRRSWKR